jgi:hypothetical protein
VTQHESFPGRPRGRRARQDNGESAWQTTGDQREFPDLPPVRPREARALDSRGLPGQHARPSQPGGYDGYQAGTPAPAGGGYGTYGGGQYQGGGYGDQGQAPQAPGVDQGRAGQPPWPDQQASPYPAPPRYEAPQREVPRQPREQRQPQEEETPSWAEPDSMKAFSERWHRRGREAHREEQQAGQRKRRRLLIAGGVVVALAVAVTAYLLSGGPGAASLGFGNFVTNFLPGELQQVPNPCTAVPAATLQADLPGKPKEAAPPLNSGQSTECSWTLDSPPTYRVLDVQFQAYSPSGLASGDGSATFAAEDAFQSFENGYAKPGTQSGLLSSKVADLSGMPGGTVTSAFQATEVFNRGGATQDLAYVYVRYRNVIIRVMAQGLDQSSGGKTYTVQMSTLTGIANSVAKEMAATIAK